MLLYCIVFCCFLATVFNLDCSVPTPSKIDCGYAGITSQQCVDLGCCWKPVPVENEPWCFHSSFSPKPSFNGSFTTAEVDTMKNFFLENINVQNHGGVAASFDNNTFGGGSYYSHWMRDAAISMHVVDLVIDNSDRYMEKYVEWVQKAQNEHDPNPSQDIRGEPRFNLPDGDVFTGPWCRPQNDGAGLRASTLGEYGKRIFSSKEAFVRNTVWPLVKNDCDYVASVWMRSNCDLWEEVQGEFLFTLLVQRRGLLSGVDLARLVGDASAADKFKNAAENIKNAAAKHWNGQFLMESTNRQIDSASILGILYGYADDGFLGYTDPQVVSTLSTLHATFFSQFPLNARDDAANVPGVLWGRYPGDTYVGGNPWILNTAAAADLYFRQAKVLQNQALRKQNLSVAQIHSFSNLLGVKNDSLLSSGDIASSLTLLASNLVQVGDGILTHIRTHVLPFGMHLPEQINKNDGSFANAHDLTWSYGSVLLAMHNRPSNL